MISISAPLRLYDVAVRQISGSIPEAFMLLFVRVVLGGVFWRSGETKVVEGSWFTLTDTTRTLFHTEYAAVPFPPDLAAALANAAEHILPMLLLVGLFTRASALGLVVMTLVIQMFVYPDAWWPEHSLWIGLALVLIVRGGGRASLDRLLVRRRYG